MSGKLHDNVSRDKKPSPVAKSIFVGLRAADVFWQYNLLTRGWGIRLIEKLGGHAVSPLHIFNPLSITGLQPYYALVGLLSLGSSAKQIIHMTFIFEQSLTVGTGVTISVFNIIFDTFNTLLSLLALTSPVASIPESNTLLDTFSSSPMVALGLGAYAVGLLVEAGSEFQRKAFKQDPRNKGKPYGGGLFSLATNINYGGFTVWRAGYAMVCGGFAWGAMTFGLFFYDFASRGVPVLHEYMTEKVSFHFSILAGWKICLIDVY